MIQRGWAALVNALRFIVFSLPVAIADEVHLHLGEHANTMITILPVGPAVEI